MYRLAFVLVVAMHMASADNYDHLRFPGAEIARPFPQLCATYSTTERRVMGSTTTPLQSNPQSTTALALEAVQVSLVNSLSSTHQIAHLVCKISAHDLQVLFPTGYTFLSGSLFLGSNLSVYISTGATLLGSTLWDAYPLGS